MPPDVVVDSRRRLHTRNLIVAGVAALALALSLMANNSGDVLRPYLFALALAICAKLCAEYFLALPMRLLVVQLQPEERAARGRVLVAMLLLATWLLYGIHAW